MYKRVFLDANIIADIYDESRPYHKQSDRAITLLAQNRSIELFTSCDIITTIYYILSKKNRDQALDAIIQVNELCTIVEFGNEEVLKSCMLMKKNNLYKDLEDTIQYIMAQKESCDLILSNDRGFVSEEINLMRSEEFISGNDKVTKPPAQKTT